ncbi:MAG: hypothetical protein KDA59_13160, partial [Planctomycetales bacterium]|nr:hypothetical protein [Planctomycetales bacterium]
MKWLASLCLLFSVALFTVGCAEPAPGPSSEESATTTPGDEGMTEEGPVSEETPAVEEAPVTEE